MAKQHQVRRAAGEFVDEFADHDEEFELHQALVSDETFGTLCHCLRELNIQARYGDDPSAAVEDHADTAADKLRGAMESRAAQLRQEVQD